MISPTVILTLIGIALGFVGMLILSKIVRASIIKDAESDADDLISQAQQNLDDIINDLKREHEDIKLQELENLEKELEPRFTKLDRDLEILNEKKQELEEDLKERERSFQSQSDRLRNQEKKSEQRKTKFKEIKQSKLDHIEKYKSELIQKSSADKNELIAEIAEFEKNNTSTRMNKWAQDHEQEASAQIDKDACFVVNMAINRFARPYCPERGISYVSLVNEKVRNKIFADDQKYYKLLEELCGVDLIFKEDMNSVSVSGFDPVRRELGRASLEKLTKEKRIDEKSVKNLVHRTKKSLFKKIKMDGKRVTKELRLDPFHPEVTNMLGALRYRYSFTQNQHFHCAEAGFLTGLLGAELGLPIKDARRIGLLHDLGKAMDHSIDGGHAVIGADFIEKHGEEPHIVHAVRAHHFDEQPSTDLAYLVIAGDALSGARPGARRSTNDTYMQKMDQLVEIGNSFKEINDTFIMAAGREVRVQVDSKRVSDMQAVDLGQRVAKKIEEECTYPGMIKVTVVRKTHSVNYAK